MPQESEQNDKKWLQIIELHQYTKEIFINAEETDKKFRSFLQPGIEEQHAYEHIIRARSREYGLLDESPDYTTNNLEKALGHEYRAFFDAADWLGVRIREKLIDLLRPYSNECITIVFPQYYHEIKPQVEEINIKIAGIRASKDIAKGDVILNEVKHYQNELNQLLELLKNVNVVIPALQEFKRKEKKLRIIMNWIIPIITGIVVGIVTGIVLFLVHN